MKNFEGNGERIVLGKVREAFRLALEDVAGHARSRAARRTGEYASTIRAVAGDTTGAVGSDHPATTAIERGADVGARRGPHMRGQPAIRPVAQERFGQSYGARMRSLPRQGG